ncbi:GntR family transcriptional regulator [uncultured Roseobacter sp.]|uniref:GntR family transcriptional regulator n=1 Tax=uncultured Roseobacter sp. TaxID=114847 RepID=UPI00260894EF|nr:GntR family transcriptional regulator [uncultured Roseobacter sp.]
MTAPVFNSWQAVRDEVLRRLQARIWRPGEMIPNEADLADELGCARVTVNRALRALSDAGLLERRRKAGTRVALHPVRRATLEIPMIRRQIEQAGHAYGYHLISAGRAVPDAALQTYMRARSDAFLQVHAVHLQEGVPFVAEDRWINLETVPAAASQDFSQVSANEWLLQHAPFSRGDITFAAENASAETADLLQTQVGAAVFVTERTTWFEARSVTFVRLSFAPGYRMQTEI